jgi:hypothetical protein
MSAASLALQKAMVAALTGDATFSALATGVFDTPPPGQTLPFASFGADVVGDWSHKTGEGRTHRVQLSIWANDGDTVALRQMMAAAEAALAGLPSALEGHRLVSFRAVRSLVLRDARGPDQGVIEFRALTLKN